MLVGKRFKIEKHNDSADDLDGYASDDAPMSQKIPDSQVKMNTDMFAGANSRALTGTGNETTGIPFLVVIHIF